MPRDDKVAILKDSLAAIGRRIEAVLAQKQAAGEDRERWRRHLWTYVDRTLFIPFVVLICYSFSFVTLFWPKKVKASKLEEIHAKMVMKEAAPRSTSQVENGQTKKPRPGGSGAGRTNGSGSGPSSSYSSSVRTNGKYR